MRNNFYRIHHHVSMDEDNVPEYMVLKIVQSRRFRIQIFKMGRCNARTHFSHPPPRFYGWGECIRVYVLKVVQSRRFRIQILKMRHCNMKTHFSHPPSRFYGWRECTRVYGFKSSSVQTVPHPNFENGTLQCENTCLASTTTFLLMRRV